MVRFVNEKVPDLNNKLVYDKIRPIHHVHLCPWYRCQTRLCALPLESSERKKSPREGPLAKALA